VQVIGEHLEVLDVTTGAESAPCAGKHNGPNFAIVAYTAQNSQKGLVHFIAEGIHRLWAVEPDDANWTIRLDPHDIAGRVWGALGTFGGCAHEAFFPSMWTAGIRLLSLGRRENRAFTKKGPIETSMTNLQSSAVAVLGPLTSALVEAAE